MRSLTEPPTDLPPIENLIDEPPTSLLGMPIEWRSRPIPEPVFLRTFHLGPSGVPEDTVFLFAASYNMADVLLDGKSFGDEGFFVEYFVIDRSGGEWVLHRLGHHGAADSVAYAEADESGDDSPDIAASEIDDPARFALDKPPKWKASEASWPSYRGAPMKFIGQIYLPETEVTRNSLPWGHTLYLFVANAADRRQYKIVAQETHGQTAEEHYELEEQLQKHDEAASSNGG